MLNLYSEVVIYIVLFVPLFFGFTNSLDNEKIQKDANDLQKGLQEYIQDSHFLQQVRKSYNINFVPEEKQELEVSFRMGLEDYIRGANTRTLRRSFQAFHFPQLFRKAYNTSSVPGNLVCIACNIVVGVTSGALRSGIDTNILKNLIIYLCVGMGIETETVCKQIINLHINIIFHIFMIKKDLTEKRFCSIVFQSYGCIDPKRKDWSVYIPPRQNIKKYRNRQNRRSLKILQLTDVHYSLEYGEGSNAACNEPLCCQSGTTPSGPENAAQKWGDYRNCDLPLAAFIDSINQIYTTHKDLDYIYFTGDIVDHKVWDTSPMRNMKSISDVYNLFRQAFGSQPFFPVLGNHETHPVNVYSINASDVLISSQWVFELSHQYWSMWLPQNTQGTVLKGGFYTVLVKPGFRIIGLNSNMCYVYNWWLLYDDVDPFKQLEWLVLVLLKAEANNEKVHILSHVPSGDAYCLMNWGREYSRIVSRFSDTIAAQFNGHTHTIEKIIYYDTEDVTKPVNVAFNGGSLTPYSNINSNYAIYTVDGTTLEVNDYDLWIYNLEEANLTPDESPRWFKLYSFKNAYNVTSLSPQNMDDLVVKMAKECQLANQFFKYKYKNAAPSILPGCDKSCQIENLCNLVTSYYGSGHCDRIKVNLKVCPKYGFLY